MLKQILVQNYALIDNLEIDFFQGLNTITGETGAGKSILLGALGLILGNRAEANVLKDKSKPCVVEGVFDISAYNREQFFVDNDLDYSDITTIRRHISSNGKSRAFVNEIPVNLTVLKDVVGQFIDIHSQHENLLLADSAFQLMVLDSYTENTIRVASFKDVFTSYKNLLAELQIIKDKARQAKADLDYLLFQLNQIEEAKLQPGEDVELENLQQQLSHAEEIKSTLQNVMSYLNSDESSVLAWLKDSENFLNRISSYYPSATGLSSRIESCRIELKDIYHEVENQSQKIQHDPEKLELVNNRLDTITTLLQKHRLANVNELIELRESIRGKVSEITSSDEAIESKERELEMLKQRALAMASEISQFRKSGLKNFEESIKGLLNQMGMQYADFKVNITELDELRLYGTDKVTFLFSANKQIALQELSKVASGGELSRLMLSLKSLMVKSKGLPTVILDEIDTGVSGEVAHKVGTIIGQMAKGMQVINITHLPQIASKGENHYLVFKEHSENTTITNIRRLNKEERVIEIAKMLSGDKVTEAALTNAKHLLSEEVN